MVDNGIGCSAAAPPPPFPFNVLMSSEFHSMNRGTICKDEKPTEAERKRRENEGEEEEEKEKGTRTAKKKKPYKELTLEEKVELIRLAERCSNLSQASIAERYAIAKSNVCRILQRKDEYIMALESAGFAGSRKRKLRAMPSGGAMSGGSTEGAEKATEEGPTNGENCDQQTEEGRMGDGREFTEEITADMELLAEDNGRDTDALRAHMSSEHSLGRVFLCRCCNWAFRDKNSLHEHLKERRTKEQKTAAERSEGNGVSLKAEQKRPSDTLPSAADIVPMPVGDVPPAIGISLAQLPLSSEQNTLMADIWSNILLSQTQLRNNLANGGRAPTEREQQNVPKTDGAGQNTSSDHQFATHFASSFASASQSLPLPPPLSSSSSSFSASSFVPSLPNGGGTTVIVQNGVSSSSSSFSSSSSSSSMPSNCLIHSSSLPLGSSSFDSDSELSSHSQTISPTHSDVGGRRAVVVPSLQQKRSNAATGEGAANRQQNATEQPQQSAKCAQCLVAKPRLVLAQAKCSYLEATTVTFQNELLRLNAKCLLAEQCIRRLEMELRQWRERNDFLRFRLLECREKTLEIIAGGGSAGAELSKFVGDVLKITLV